MAKAMTNARRALRVLTDLRPTGEPITLAEWRDGCGAWAGGRAATMYDIRKKLLAQGLITIDDAGLIRRSGNREPTPARTARKHTYDADLKSIAELLRQILAAVTKPSL